MMKIIASDVRQNADVIICPFCDSEFVHPIGIKVYPVNGTTECKILHSGIQIKSSDAAKTQRGVSLVHLFACESGHIWSSEFLFEKGQTFVKTALVKTMTRKEFEKNNIPETIWRD